MEINGVKMITDRSLYDVQRARRLVSLGLQGMTEEERDEFLSGLKGAYNYTDFNRVESAVKYLAERLYALPDELEQLIKEYNVNDSDFYKVSYNQLDYENVITKTNWNTSDILSSQEENRYIKNIELILKALDMVKADLPKFVKRLTHTNANKIEQYLVDFNEEFLKLENIKKSSIIGTAKSWFYSGDLYGGEI